MSKTYSEKLRDPRWQRKRLEVMQRDNFSCGYCPDNSSTLHVHHKYYLPGTEPWDYPDECLITLCESCHENEEALKYAQGNFIHFLQDKGMLNIHFEAISDPFCKLSFEEIYKFFRLGSEPLFVEEVKNLIRKHTQYQIDNRKDLPL